MGNNNYKRICSWGMAFAFVLAICSISLSPLAAEPTMKTLAKGMITDFLDKEELSQTNVENVMQELDAMEDHAIALDRISINEIDKDGNVTYAYQILDDLISYVDVKQGEDGSVSFHYVEGERENTLCYAPDGNMYLDGYLITVSYPDKKMISSDSDVTTRSGFYSFFQTDIPTGTTFSQYSGPTSFYMSSGIVDFGQAIGSMALGAAAGIIVTIYSGGNISLGAEVASALAGLVIYACCSNDLLTHTASWVEYRRPLVPQYWVEPKYQHIVTWTVAGITLDPVYHYEVRTPI
jgi:hypothetical protein